MYEVRRLSVRVFAGNEEVVGACRYTLFFCFLPVSIELPVHPGITLSCFYKGKPDLKPHRFHILNLTPFNISLIPADVDAMNTVSGWYGDAKSRVKYRFPGSEKVNNGQYGHNQNTEREKYLETEIVNLLYTSLCHNANVLTYGSLLFIFRTLELNKLIIWSIMGQDRISGINFAYNSVIF